jgi:hypothetical protein
VTGIAWHEQEVPVAVRSLTPEENDRSALGWIADGPSCLSRCADFDLDVLVAACRVHDAPILDGAAFSIPQLDLWVFLGLGIEEVARDVG